MLNLRYIKEYSFRIKKSTTNNDVVMRIDELENKTKSINSMRVNVFRQVILELPYSFRIIKIENNENTAIIRLILKVEVLKLIILFTISSLVVTIILAFVANSFLVIFPIALFAFLFYLLSRQKVLNFTKKFARRSKVFRAFANIQWLVK